MANRITARNTMTKRYHTLLVRDDATCPWGIAFGDYSRRVVADERNDLQDNEEYSFDDMRIIATTDDQASIDAEVARLNGRDILVIARGLAYDGTTRDWTQKVEFVGRNRQEALDWIKFNRDWFKDLHIVE
jgi:hypothetical protein